MRDASAPRSAWRRSPPRSPEHRDLLAKRLTTVDKLRREMLDKWDNKAPARASKEIPIPLQPGETYAHYKHEFDWWLRKTKNESLESVRRKDANYERTLWFCYALQRSGTTSRETAKRDAHSYYGPPPSDSKRQRTEGPGSALPRPSTRSEEKAPSSSAELDGLAPKDKPAEAKTPEDKSLHAVNPTGLGPKDKTLEDKPLENKTPTYVKMSAETSSCENEGPQKVTPTDTTPSAPTPRPLSLVGYLPAPREEYLAQRILTPEEYLVEIAALEHKSTPGVLDDRLTKIPVPLLPGKTLGGYEQAFCSWLAKRSESLESLRFSPIKERGLRCQFALERAFKATSTSRHNEKHCGSEVKKFCGAPRDEQSVHEDVDGPKTDTSGGLSGETSNGHQKADKPTTGANSCGGQPNSDPSTLPETLPAWAVQLIQRVQTLEAEMSELRQEVKYYRAAAAQSVCSSDNQSLTSPSGSAEKPSTSIHSTVMPDSNASPSQSSTTLDKGVTDDSIIYSGTGTPANDVKAQDSAETSSNSCTSKPMKPPAISFKLNKFTTTQRDAKAGLMGMFHTSSADIYRVGSLNLARAVESRVIRQKSEVKTRKLKIAYKQLNDQIILNETAINDAVAYVKTIKDADEAMAMEHQGQIMELVVSVNKEKEKRSAALAGLIVHEWAGRNENLRFLLQQGASATQTSEAKHERLSALSLRTVEATTKLDELETALSYHLQAVCTIPPTVKGAARALRFSGLQNLIAKLEKQQVVMKKLEAEREKLLTGFLQGDDEVRRVVIDLLDQKREGRPPWLR